MPLPITALYAGLIALWMIFLTVSVIVLRREHRVSLGDGGNDRLGRRIRGHANAVEQAPIALILLGLSEGLGTPGWAVHLLGVMLLAGRVLHGLHFLEKRKGLLLRQLGMVLTFLSIAFLAFSAIGHALAEIA
ncbi:MAG: MAPEG family protein [Pseudomonadota bacterium]